MSKITDLKHRVKISIEENDSKQLEELFKNEENLKQLQSYKFFDVFVCAIKSNQLHFIKYFYSKGFPINCSFSTNKRKFKEEKEDDNDDDEDEKTGEITQNIVITEYSNALIEAIKCCNIEAVMILNELKVNFNSTDYKHIPLQISYNLYQKLKCNKESKLKIKVCILFIHLQTLSQPLRQESIFLEMF
jgi:hypothetical protein